jgi:lipopolysaccharide export system protein LptA
MLRLLLLLLFTCGLVCSIYGQATLKQGTKQITIRNAETLLGNSENGEQRLLGDVQFEHEGALMYCDSAYYNTQKNMLEAFSRVHIVQGDSINLWGDFLRYDGATRIAEVQKNVKLTDGDMTLTADAILYDMSTGIASYATGGKIINQENTLTSSIGTYTTESKTLTFKKEVVLNNPRYVMRCDTLRYQPESKTAWFLGPTTIKSTTNSDFIYCENGFYNTDTDVCQFERNAYIVTEAQRLSGDSLWYDRKNGLGKAIRNVQLVDTAQRITITGDLAVHNEKTETSTITGNTLFIQRFDKDSLFLHADTLLTITKDKEENQTEAERQVHAYHGVRIYKSDLQGKSDSLAWTSVDSTMRLFGDPVLWSGGNQLTAEYIDIIVHDGRISKLEMDNLAFIVSKDDSSQFNQIKGKHMTGHFKENELYLIEADGNAQTLYYAHDQGLLVGINRADCRRLKINIKDDKVVSIQFYDKPDAVLYPPKEIPQSESLLKGFRWRVAEQPLSVKDLFVK